MQKEEIPLGPQGLSIGRDLSNSVKLEEPVVSSRHCRIECHDGSFVLVDDESTNGTFVNGKATTRAHLEHGDEISVGSTKFYFFTDDIIDWAAHEAVVDDYPDEVFSRETVRLNPVDSASDDHGDAR